MPTYDPVRVATALQRLFSTFPLPAAANDPAEAVKVYFEICEGHSTTDIEYAVKRFMTGSIEGHNPSFAPTPALMAIELRRLAQDSIKYEGFDRSLAKQLTDRSADEERRAGITDESRHRVRELMDNLVTDQSKIAGGGPMSDEVRKRLEKFDHEHEGMFNAGGDYTISRALAAKLRWTAGDDQQARDD